jgi:Protein of unknown function (DUF4231)
MCNKDATSNGKGSADTAEQYIETRVHFKAEAYNRKSIAYRMYFLTCSTLTTVAAASVPVMINIADVPKVVPTLLSLLVTVLVGVEGIFHFREHWKNCDLIKTFLRQEILLFQAKAGVYSVKDDHERKVLLVERVEDAISKERMTTILMRTDLKSPGADASAGKPREGQVAVSQV